jgi:hypothetical protein
MQIAAESTTFPSLRSTAISASSATSTHSRLPNYEVTRRNRGAGRLQALEGFDGCDQGVSHHQQGRDAAYRNLDSNRDAVAGAGQPVSITETERNVGPEEGV